MIEMGSQKVAIEKKGEFSRGYTQYIQSITHHSLTWGGVGVDVGLPMGGVGFLLPPPDIISSVMSLPPWFGSRILI